MSGIGFVRKSFIGNCSVELLPVVVASRTAAGIESFLPSGYTTPSMAAMRNERWSRMMNELSGLPKRQREVVVKYYFNRVQASGIPKGGRHRVPCRRQAYLADTGCDKCSSTSTIRCFRKFMHSQLQQ